MKGFRFPNETAEYRARREALLDMEIALRDQVATCLVSADLSQVDLEVEVDDVALQQVAPVSGYIGDHGASLNRVPTVDRARIDVFGVDRLEHFRDLDPHGLERGIFCRCGRGHPQKHRGQRRQQGDSNGSLMFHHNSWWGVCP